MTVDQQKYQTFMQDMKIITPVYLVSIPSTTPGPENYSIGKTKHLWGVVDNYMQKIQNVKQGEYIVFFGARVGLSIYKLASSYFYDLSSVWNDDTYPHRVKLENDPILDFKDQEFSTYDMLEVLVDIGNNHYSNGQALGMALRGGGGIFRKLNDTEINNLIGIIDSKLTTAISPLDAAARKILDIYNGMDQNDKKNLNDARDEALKKYGNIFKKENINNLDIEDLKKFLDPQENRRWKLDRQKGNIEKNNTIQTIREGLSELLDENKDIQERLNDANEKLKNFGPTILTGILLFAYPDKYFVLNEPSFKALKKLELIDYPTEDKAFKNYKSVNQIVNELSKKTNLDLWTIDDILGKLKGKTTVEGQWWIEKTNVYTHTDPSIPRSCFSESLWSPQTSRDGKKIYDNMKQVNGGDKILHLLMDYDNLFAGVSIASGPCSTGLIIPKGHGVEKDTPGYIIYLNDYVDISDAKLYWVNIREKYIQEVIEILEKNEDLFYDKDLDLNQGKYLTKVPNEFIEIINNEYKEIYKTDLPHYKEENSELEIPYLSPEEQQLFNNFDKLLEKKNQIIFYGPAGTGKTYYALNYAKSKKHYQIITFHQSLSYEEFVEGIKPVVFENNHISYQVKDGLFKKYNFLAILLALKANEDKILPQINLEDLNEVIDYIEKGKNKSKIEEKYNDLKRSVWKYISSIGHDKLKTIFSDLDIPKVYLIIDEINRGNISKIFGELITLIEKDKRLSAKNMTLLKLPYSNEDFSVSPNFYIIGTMNTSDKSIALIDTALRRRFSFWEMRPDFEKLSENIEGLNLRDLLKKINNKIETELDKDHAIGQSYFIDAEGQSINSIEELYDVWYTEIIPHLEEMFYGNYDKIETILGKGNFYDPSHQLKILSDKKEDFINALKGILTS